MVILTTSQAETDIVKSYELHANCYLNKPVEWDAFASLVKSINDFWLTKVRLPQQRLREADLYSKNGLEQVSGASFQNLECDNVPSNQNARAPKEG